MTYSRLFTKMKNEKKMPKIIELLLIYLTEKTKDLSPAS